MNRSSRTPLAALLGAAAALLAAAAPAAAAPSFAPAQRFATGACPTDAAVADFDRDGAPDLVLTQTCGAGLGVLLGRGDGTFGPEVRLELDDNATGVAVDDFDRDGSPDVAASIGFDGRVAVVRGHGDGTFAPAVEHDAGGYASDVAAGDVSGDGHADLVVASGTKLLTLLGRGDGAFAAATEVDTGAGVNAVGLGDVDGDGGLDVVAARSDANDVFVLRAGGPPASYPTSRKPVAVALADVDGDGKLDAATANWSGSCMPGDDFCDADVSFLRGDGAGAFAVPALNLPAQVGPQAVAAGDLDLDGLPDLAVVNRGSASVSLFAGGAAGFATQTTIDSGGGMPSGVAVADFDGDLRPDVVSANYGPDEIAVMLNTTVAAPLVVTAGASEVTATGARLAAKVNPTGIAATYRFEYGTSTAYGSATGDLDGGSGGALAPAAATATGLQPGTTYHYRVVATNARGTRAGADATFTTPAAPPERRDPAGEQPLPPVGQTGTTPPAARRVKPRGVTVWIAPTDDRRPPIRYRLRGSVMLPAGLDAATACRGQVRLELRHGRRVVAVRNARVGSRCGWSRGIWLDRADGLDADGSGRLRLTMTFRGNPALQPLPLAARTLTFGPR